MIGYYNDEAYELINFRGYTWVKVFYHDSSGGWFNANTAKHTGNYDSKLYSRLDTLQDLKMSSESKYVFCLNYPEQSGRWNIWKQTLRPQDDYNNNTLSEGYEPIIINSSDSNWGGLSCSDQYAFIDGDKYSNHWWFAIGSYSAYSTSIGIPGPNGIVVSQVELWIATDLSKFRFDTGTQISFDYFGNYHKIELGPGKYKLECWGAEGGGQRISGNTYSGFGGYGGYSCGTLSLTFPTILYAYVGGYGGSSNGGVAAGGWNGGGSGYGSSSTEPGNGGGGASDIRIGNTSLYARVIVAGGGGGGGEDAGDSYGHGGGIDGGWNGATQTAAGVNGSFGQGASTNYGDGGGGGGGWYGGGTSSSSSIGSDTQGGGGGSGYVYTESTYNNYPIGCLLNSDYYLTETQTIAGQRLGHGYIVITAIESYTANFKSYEDYLESLPITIPLSGDQINFVSKQSAERILLGPGKYKLECWGAQGGSMESGWTGIGGLGGYASGVLTLTKRTFIHICVGQQGQGYNSSYSVHYGGWNGGGDCYAGASGGGGASDIRINYNSIYARVLVAGGGGGSNDHQNGGAGGGLQGGTGVNGSATNGEGGSQTAGGRGWLQGSFGQGAGHSSSYGDGGAGGGGWYGGGKASGNAVAGGGGSGYVYNDSNAKNYPTGCLLNSSYYLEYGKNVSGDNTFYSPNGNLENGHTGNGYARITNVTDSFQVEFYYTETLEPIILTPGRYKFEAYGALGGMYTSGYGRQEGGYTRGIVDIKRTMTIYAACGRRGLDYSVNHSYGMQFNGGGEGYGSGGDGGGATDFRLIDGTWDDTESLKSRIFVSGGAGGSDSNSRGGLGGGLIGESCYTPQTGSVATGGTQTGGGVQPSNTAVNGRFGMGGGATFSSENDAGGGGGGYYGGAAGTGGHAAGAGGSSFATGWPGCDTTYNSYHFNLKFSNVILNQGGGIGDGVARITRIKTLPASVYKIDFNLTRGIKNTLINANITNIVLQNQTSKFILDKTKQANLMSNTALYFDSDDISQITLNTNVLPGYTFQDYSGYITSTNTIFDLVLPRQDIQINISATPNTDTPYTVRHNLMNLDGETYTRVSQQVLYGTTDTSVTPETNVYEGFTAPSVQTVNIDGTGTRIVSYLYSRNKYKVTPVKDAGCASISQSTYVFYGDTKSISVGIKPGYDWVEWDGESIQYTRTFSFTMPAHDVVFNAHTSPWSGILYKVVHKKMNLDGKTYTIDGIDEFDGHTDEVISPPTKNYVGFTSPSVQTTTIIWDGTTVVEYLYTRNKYKLTLAGDKGCGSFTPGNSTDIFYGQRVQISFDIRPGYDFNRWLGDVIKYIPTFSMNMPSKDMYCYAYTIPRDDIPYKVIHEKMNTTGTGYDVVLIENFVGTVDTNVSSTTKTYVGFITPVIQIVNLEGDGSTVIRYLYDREQYNLILGKDGFIDAVFPFDRGKVYQGQTITIKAVPHVGYDFDKWVGYRSVNTASFQFTMPLQDVIFNVYSVPRNDTLYTVKHQKIDFDTGLYTPFEIEEMQGTSNTSVTPAVKTIQGLVSPSTQTVNIDPDGSRVVLYNYERLSYNLYVQNGTAPKYRYYFEERVNLTSVKQPESHPLFKAWFAQEDAVKFKNAYRKETFFYMPPCDAHVYVVYHEPLFRKNSNIYKNIFYTVIFDVENLDEVIARIPIGDEQFYQENHGFSVGDVLQFDQEHNKYVLACADTFEHARVDGVVAKVHTEHIFTIFTTGKFKYHTIDNFTDTSILYLSDTIPGKMCHYQDITNTTYVPVAVLCNDEVVVNIIRGVTGITLFPYESYQEMDTNDLYTQQEIEDTINQIWSNVT